MVSILIVSQDGLVMKNCLPVQETQVPSLGWKDPLEMEMATHSSILAWRIRGQRSLEGYSPWGHKRVGYNLATKQQQHNKSSW